MNRIIAVGIEGYKSIQRLERLELGAVNVLIGPNGSGKSNLIDFFRLLNHAMTEALQDYVRKRGFAESFLYLGARRTSRIVGDVEFEAERGTNRYRFALEPAAGDSLVFAEEVVFFQAEGHSRPIEIVLVPAGRENVLARNGIAGLNSAEAEAARDIKNQLARKRVYQFHDTSPESRLRKASDIEDNRRPRSDGRNLPAVLFRLLRDKPEYYRAIILQLRRMIPKFRDFVLEPEGNHVLLRWRGHDPEYVFGPHQLSDGSLRLMALATLFQLPPEDLPEMIIVDEPELGLHPQAEALLAGMIRSVSARCQVLLATQSASFVDHFELEDEIVCEMSGGASRFHRPSPSALEAWLDEYTLGDVWRKNIIGGQP